MKTLLQCYQTYCADSFDMRHTSPFFGKIAINNGILKSVGNRYQFTKLGLARYAAKTLPKGTIMIVYRSVPSRNNWAYRDCKFFIGTQDITGYIADIMTEYRKRDFAVLRFSMPISQIAHELEIRLKRKVVYYEF